MESIFIVALIGLSALLLVPLAGQSPRSPGADTAVLLVDLQGDFTFWKEGALAVDGTDKAYIDSVRDATRRLHRSGYPVYACQDWHPPDHISFYTNHSGKKPFDIISVHGHEQVLWPPHCVQDSENAGILIDETLIEAVVRKGKDPRYDSYSGFKDDGGRSTGLKRILTGAGIAHLILYGLATDYCVRATVRDAVQAGFQVTLVADLCRGVAPATTAAALEEIRSMGVAIVSVAELNLR